ncbi:MAG: hypothetical protein GC165_19470 [Armatimonadetes bacterium]|nr:hypothetical protein [Armatimonadota bacterium]
MTFLVPLVALAQAAQKPLLMEFKAPCGIYKPDYSSCAEKDRDLYQAIFPGYLSITPRSFNVSYLAGAWKDLGNQLQLKVETYNDHEIGKASAPFSGQTYFSGLVMVKGEKGDLVLLPAPGQVMQSKLTFRLLPAPTLESALVETQKAELGSVELETTLAYGFMVQFWENKHFYAPKLLQYITSDAPLNMKWEACMYLMDVHSDDVVKIVGELLLQQPYTEKDEQAKFRIILGRVLSATHRPGAAYFAIQAHRRKLMSAGLTATTLGNSGNQDAVPFLKDLFRDAKPSQKSRMLQDLRHLNGQEALAAARGERSASDPDLHFEVLRTLVECSDDLTEKGEAIRQLQSAWTASDWMKQCEIIDSFGSAGSELAHKFLKTLTRQIKSDPLLWHLTDALAKYKKPA